MSKRDESAPLTERLIKVFKPRYTEIIKKYITVFRENGRIHQRILDLQGYLFNLLKVDLVHLHFGTNERNLTSSFLLKHREMMEYINKRYNYIIRSIN